jgi:hypothetical protein
MYKPLATRYSTAIAMADRLRSLAREQTETAINTIVGIMNAQTTSDRDKLTAAFGLLDRGWGKPQQTMVYVDAQARPPLPAAGRIDFQPTDSRL